MNDPTNCIERLRHMPAPSAPDPRPLLDRFEAQARPPRPASALLAALLVPALAIAVHLARPATHAAPLHHALHAFGSHLADQLQTPPQP